MAEAEPMRKRVPCKMFNKYIVLETLIYAARTETDKLLVMANASKKLRGLAVQIRKYSKWAVKYGALRVGAMTIFLSTGI